MRLNSPNSGSLMSLRWPMQAHLKFPMILSCKMVRRKSISAVHEALRSALLLSSPKANRSPFKLMVVQAMLICT
ncbi:Uncharacterised protein [Vibrio cholerae]|nr:Uncharacterised protein [Vibrio cholerae]